MTRIRLRVAQRPLLNPCSYRNPQSPNAPPVELPLLRLTADAVVQAPPGIRKAGYAVTAMIDTGSWLSVVEHDTLRDLDAAGLIEYLPFADGRPQTTYLAGHAVAYRLGRLWVTLVDATPTGLAVAPAVPVVAQLLQSPTSLLGAYPLILGLHSGVLDGRKLTREVVPVHAAPLPPNRATDCGAWFGQEWYLESV